MSTVVLNAYSKAYPTIINRLRASVYLQSSPQAFVASIIDAVAGHPARTWSFPGLPRNNYGFSLDEIDISDNVVTNLALFDVVPGEIDGTLVRDDEQIQVGVTPGFDTGLNSFVFDGTETAPSSGIFKPNYIGWEIVPSELTGRGILVRGLDYSWDAATGTFTLLLPSDIFAANNWYNIHFEPIQNPVGNSYPSLRDFTIRLITSNTTLTAADFGNKLIVEPSSVYVEVTLPSLATIVEGRPLMVEISGSEDMCCVRFIPTGGDVLNFLRGKLYALPNESFTIYKYTRSPGIFEFRVCDVDGNFKTVGQSVADDMVPDRGFGDRSIFNKQLLDGSSVDKTQFARIYNEIVLYMPVAQVVNYDDWITGNNKYYYSLANSANPSFVDQFHFPDRRGIYERNNTSGGKPGDWQDWQMIDHQHEGVTGTLPSTLFGRGLVNRSVGLYNGVGVGKTDLASKPVDETGAVISKIGSEIRVQNYAINKYVLI